MEVIGYQGTLLLRLLCQRFPLSGLCTRLALRSKTRPGSHHHTLLLFLLVLQIRFVELGLLLLGSLERFSFSTCFSSTSDEAEEGGGGLRGRQADYATCLDVQTCLIIV